MIIPRVVPQDELIRDDSGDPLASAEFELTMDEVLAKRPDPNNGIFLCTPLFVNPLREPSSAPVGAMVATRTLFRGMAAHPRIRRWYTSFGRLETYPADRDPQLLIADHVVPAPMFNPVSYAETAVLMDHGFVHALLSTGPTSPNATLLRGALGSTVPHISCLHTISEPTAAWFNFVSGPTYEHDLVISPSECGKRAVMAHWDRMSRALACRPYRGEIEVIPWGVELPPHVDRDVARARMGWPQDDIVFVSIARFDRDFKYDPSPLLLAFKEVHRRNPRVRLVLAGAAQQADLALIDDEVIALGLEDRVELRQDFPESHKPHLLGGADVFIAFSDNVQETHGLSVLEAMTAGLPVIAADWDGYKETVEDGVCGVRVPVRMQIPDRTLQTVASIDVAVSAPAFQYQHVVIDLVATINAFETFAADPALRQRMGAAGRERAATRYEATLVADKVVKAIEARVQRSRNATPITGELGSDWRAVYGHFPSSMIEADTRIARGPWTVADLTMPTKMALEIDRRPMLATLFDDATTQLAAPTTLSNLVATLKPRHAFLNEGAIARWLVRGAKYGLYTLG